MTEQEKAVKAIYEAGEVVKLELPDVSGKPFEITDEVGRAVHKIYAGLFGKNGGWTKGRKRK